MPYGIGMYLSEEEAGKIHVDVASHEVIFNTQLQRFLYFFVLRNKNALLVFLKELRIILFQVSQQEWHFPHIALVSRLIGGKSMQARSEIISICDLAHGKISDISANSITIEISDSAQNLNNFEELLRPYGIKEIVRTGTIAIQKGEQAVSVRN